MDTKITLKVADIVDLWQTINKLHSENTKYPIKFSFALSKIQKSIRPVIESLDNIQKPSKEFDEYSEKRVALCREFSEVDEDGTPRMRFSPEKAGTEFVISRENKKEFEAKFTQLNEDYNTVLEKQQKKMDKIFEMLKEEKEITVYKISLDDFPKEFGAADMKLFLPFVQEHTVH